MQNWLEFVFWSSAGCVFYAYIGYPLLMGILAKYARRPVCVSLHRPLTISIILPVHNEANNIARRISELVSLLDSYTAEAEIIVVSDGSTDGTMEIARSIQHCKLKLIELPNNHGKAAALNFGRSAARNDVLVLADARQRWAESALELLLEPFGDPNVGGVSGDLILEDCRGTLAGIGLYWRFEKWLRTCESTFYSTVGVTGAICAVRRNLFPEIPMGTILDDVYWPLCVAMRGYRVVHEPKAQAFDRLPGRVQDEFHRKLRTLSGNFQLAQRLPRATWICHNPIWVQWWSHKLMRLIVPWAMLAMFFTSVFLEGPVYQIFCLAEVSAIAMAFGGTASAHLPWLRFASTMTSFFVLNVAAWCAFWIWVSGQTHRCWKKGSYAQIPALDSH